MPLDDALSDTGSLRAAWRRRLAEFNAWFPTEVAKDPRENAPDDDCSIEFHFERWPQPWPVAVRRAMLRRLAGVALEWQRAMQGLEGSTYLGLWIFEPAFLETQLVAARGYPARDYSQRHERLQIRETPSLYAPALELLEGWEWVRHPDPWEWDVADVDPSDRAVLARMAQRRVPRRPGQFTAAREVWRGRWLGARA